jgi:hypothetical protein
VGLSQWGQTNRIQLAHPRVDVPPPGQAAGFWSAYSTTRAAWSTGSKFRETFPNENGYRHSLAEEAEALHLVAETAVRQLKEGGPAQIDPSISNLIKLSDAGLLESYILFAKADAGIARDYEMYRRSDRDKLKRYLSDYVAARK